MTPEFFEACIAEARADNRQGISRVAEAMFEIMARVAARKPAPVEQENGEQENGEQKSAPVT